MTPSRARLPASATSEREVLWRDTLIDAAVFREWMVNIGQREAYHRLAHLFCELFVRLKAVGLTDRHSYKLRLTQT